MSIARDIEFLYEVSAFRNVERAWKQFLISDAANNAEHTFRVIWIALSARKFWEAFYKSNPHDWHLKSPRNRFNSGDWKK